MFMKCTQINNKISCHRCAISWIFLLIIKKNTPSRVLLKKELLNLNDFPPKRAFLPLIDISICQNTMNYSKRNKKKVNWFPSHSFVSMEKLFLRIADLTFRISSMKLCNYLHTVNPAAKKSISFERISKFRWKQ